MRWLLLLASLLASLGVGEWAARRLVDDVYLERQIRSGGILVPYEPGGEADLLTSEFRVGYRINRFGHRDRQGRREERTPGVPRIALLGDSFSAGWGVEFAEGFGQRLERATGIEVVNTAKNGGCPLWFVAQARHARERFAPDWLLVQLFDNDADDNRQFMDRFELDYGDRVGALPRALQPVTSLDRRIALAFDSSVLHHRYRQLERRLRGKRPRRSPYVKPGAKPEQRILTPDEAVAEHAVDLSPDRPWQGPFSFHDPAQLAGWQDMLTWNAQLLEQLIEEAAADGVRVALLYIPAYPVFLRAPAPNALAEGARAVADRHGALWVDARDAFAGHPEPWRLYHLHDGHLNAAGHAALGEALVRELAPRLQAARLSGAGSDAAR